MLPMKKGEEPLSTLFESVIIEKGFQREKY